MRIATRGALRAALVVVSLAGLAVSLVLTVLCIGIVLEFKGLVVITRPFRPLAFEFVQVPSFVDPPTRQTFVVLVVYLFFLWLSFFEGGLIRYDSPKV